MFRILIVEDDVSTCELMRRYLSETFLQYESELPAQIDTALTVRDGKSAIEMAFFNKKPYHAVILDFALPQETGYLPEIDESLCLLVRDLMPATLVIHISAYTRDHVIESHMKAFHIETIGRSFTLSKLNIDYPKQLVTKLKAFLYGARIEEQLSELFGDSGSEIPIRKSGGVRYRSARETTHQLAALSRDIVRHWNDLDERVKGRILKLFYVDASADPIRISFLSPNF